MRHPLVDGQGNFGSVDGDNAAAMPEIQRISRKQRRTRRKRDED